MSTVAGIALGLALIVACHLAYRSRRRESRIANRVTPAGEHPSPYELWRQAGGDGARYRELMRERGLLVPGEPQPLPCGWPRRKATEDVGEETSS